MTTVAQVRFHYEVEEAEVGDGQRITTLICHGRLVSSTAAQFKELVRSMIVTGCQGKGGRILIDFSDLEYMDSSGLGTVVGLKVSSLNKGDCSLELVNLSPRVRELLSLSNLTQLFSIKPYPGTGPALASHGAAISAPTRGD